MKNFLQKFRKFAGFPFVFLIIMVLFLGVTLGTSGSVQSTGKSFELQHTTADSNWSWVIFKVSAPKTVDAAGNETNMNVRLHDVYINYGTIYSNEETATLELQWGAATSEPGNFFTLSSMKKAMLFNSAYVPKEGDTPTAETEKQYNYIHNMEYRWVAPFGVRDLPSDSSYRSLNSSIYFRLVLPEINKYQNSNVLINEIVFVGEVQEGTSGTGKYVVLPVELDDRTYLPYENREKGMKEAAALIDAQKIPTISSSSYYRYGDEEQKMLMSFSEIRMGNRYIPNDLYHGDTTYNSLGLNLTYLGTLIFGTSPFGVRFFNVLASFGILVVGFFLVRRLFHGSDKAGISFAVIYALAGASISLAHFASPIMLGVFFLVSSLAACYRYYALGMKKSAPSSTVPLLLSGIAGACAVLVNGAFVIPVAGVVALFIAGVVKQRKKDRALLDEAIELAEAEEKQGVVAQKSEAGEAVEELSAKQKVSRAYTQYRYNTAAAVSVFLCTLIFGIFVFSILFVLPVSYAANKIYNGISGTSPNLFRVAFNLFAAGFTPDISGWNYLYPILVGTGTTYAVTLGIMNFVASLLGLVGIALFIYRIVLLAKNKAPFKSYMSVLVPGIGLVLSLITAAFGGGSIAFVLLANLFAFMLAAGGAEQIAQQGDKQAKAIFIVKIIALVLLILSFADIAVFTFSIPLPATFLDIFF